MAKYVYVDLPMIRVFHDITDMILRACEAIEVKQETDD